jgi:hypothetical protein
MKKFDICANSLFFHITNKFIPSTVEILELFNKIKKKDGRTGRSSQTDLFLGSMIKIKIIPFIALLLFSLLLLIAGVAAETIQVLNVQVNTIDAIMPVNIVLDASPAGIDGNDITVSLSNSSVATITNVSFPSWVILNKSTSLPSSSVQLRTIDLYENVNANAADVPFGTINLRGNAVGSTDVVLTIKNITADDGNSITPAVQSGKFTVDSGSGTPSPPASPVKLIFIHHSTGQNWLADDNGGLGLALCDNNYFVSDTNYGWGPSSIGSSTDLGNWYDWFRGPNSATYLAALYSESGQHSSYSRLASDPGGVNTIVMFKSCFPNSAIRGNPGDPVPAITSNPMKSQSAGSDTYTVANAKGIYIDLLNYFKTKQDTLFIVITAPPLIDGTYSKNARVFNQWLVNDWLKDYPYKNIYVFDFYNVLTTNGGSSTVNDLGATAGNHHRWLDGAVQHQVNLAYNTSAYPTGDDHPSQAGNLKATAEYIPLLNYAYNQWVASAGTVLDIGVYRSGQWILDYGMDGTVDNRFQYGLPTDVPVVGDFNNDGKTDIGVYRSGQWILDYGMDGTVNNRFQYGLPTDVPVVGDFNNG